MVVAYAAAMSPTRGAPDPRTSSVPCSASARCATSPTSRSPSRSSTRSPMPRAGRARAATPSRGGSSSLRDAGHHPCDGGRRPAADPRARDGRGSHRDRHARGTGRGHRERVRRGPRGRADPGERLAPRDLGAAISWVRGDVRTAIGAQLGVPDGWFVRTVVALGHPTAEARRPKSAPGAARLPREETVRSERW